MKKNYLLLIVFLLLGSGTVWYLFSNKTEKATNTLGWDRKFAVDDINEVQKVFIAKRTGETTTLTRNGNHWSAKTLAGSGPRLWLKPKAAPQLSQKRISLETALPHSLQVSPKAAVGAGNLISVIAQAGLPSPSKVVGAHGLRSCNALPWSPKPAPAEIPRTSRMGASFLTSVAT